MSERDALPPDMTDNERLRDALEDMVWQFAHRGNNKRRRWLTTGGLSALEYAFDVLGWDDPHYTTEGACEIKGCANWATCVAAYPRSRAKPTIRPRSKIGFGFLCGEHDRQWNGRDAEPASDLGRKQVEGSK